MTVLEVVALAAVGLAGTAVVLTRDPARQALVAGVFGLALAVLFFVLQAPDVALSEAVVGTVALPIMIVLTLAKIRARDHELEQEREHGEGQP